MKDKTICMQKSETFKMVTFTLHRCALMFSTTTQRLSPASKGLCPIIIIKPLGTKFILKTSRSIKRKIIAAFYLRLKSLAFDILTD